MNQSLRNDADVIIHEAIEAVKPDLAVKRALKGQSFSGDVYIVAVGKAAYQMADAASGLLDYKEGVVITKYDHVMGSIANITCYEGGHPIPDENGFAGTQKILEMTKDLKADDTVVFLLSGGGSALFEMPLVSKEELQDITSQLLACGAEIQEINTIRKRLSMVKGGKFAEHVAPARVYAVILSDIIGDPVDMIASGPTVADQSTCQEAMAIISKYEIQVSDSTRALLQKETPKVITNGNYMVIGSVRELCCAAAKSCERLGYQTIFLTDCLCCEAREAGSMLGSLALSHHTSGQKTAFIAGGETVVHLTGKGLGGRNQEIAVGAMERIQGLSNAAVFSVGSDGTDGPTDAAGGYVDGDSLGAAHKAGLDLQAMIHNNDAYHILEPIGGLVITGPTGTNVNDFAVVLIGEHPVY